MNIIMYTCEIFVFFSILTLRTRAADPRKPKVDTGEGHPHTVVEVRARPRQC